MKKNSGFTLLELLITVALISIVMAIAIPSMTTFTQNDRLTDEHQHVDRSPRLRAQ